MSDVIQVGATAVSSWNANARESRAPYTGRCQWRESIAPQRVIRYQCLLIIRRYIRNRFYVLHHPRARQFRASAWMRRLAFSIRLTSPRVNGGSRL